MVTTAVRIRPAAALAAMASLLPLPASADCTCRALGKDFDLGRSVCLSTPQGPRLATCGMVLNNTSWHLSDRPCVAAPEPTERVSEFTAPARASRRNLDQ